MSTRVNVLDTAPIDLQVQKLTEKLADQKLAIRVGKLYKDALSKEKNNFRLAELGALKGSKPWVLKAYRDGTLCVFDPDKKMLRRLNKITRDLALTCAEIDYFAHAVAALNDRDTQMHALACNFIAKVGRASLKAVEERAHFFAIARRRRLDEERAGQDVCEYEEVASAPGLVWVRVRSARALFQVGREFENCLRGSARHLNTYANQLMNRSAQFWVLRDHAGKGLIVAMVSMLEQRIVEARGFRNTPIDADCADLVRLGEAKNWRRPNGSSDPPPPAAQPPNPSSAISHFLVIPPPQGARRRH